MPELKFFDSAPADGAATPTPAPDSGGAPDPITTAVEAALRSVYPDADGPQAGNFAALRRARAEDIAKAIPVDATELAALRTKLADVEPKLGKWADMEALYARVAFQETPEWQEQFVQPLEQARAELSDLAADFGVSEDTLRALEAMSPKDRRAALEKSLPVSAASDIDNALRRATKLDTAMRTEATKLGTEGRPVKDLLDAVQRHTAQASDPGKHLGEVIAEVTGKDKYGKPVDVFFGTKEGREVLDSIKAKPPTSDPKSVAKMAVEAAAYRRIVVEYGKVLSRVRDLEQQGSMFRTAQPGGGAPAADSSGGAASAPVKGTFG